MKKCVKICEFLHFFMIYELLNLMNFMDWSWMDSWWHFYTSGISLTGGLTGFSVSSASWLLMDWSGWGYFVTFDGVIAMGSTLVLGASTYPQLHISLLQLFFMILIIVIVQYLSSIHRNFSIHIFMAVASDAPLFISIIAQSLKMKLISLHQYKGLLFFVSWCDS